MKKEVFDINSNKCTVIISNSFKNIDEYFTKSCDKKAVIITDSVVNLKYGMILEKQLEHFYDDIFTYEMRNGETSKNLNVCFDIYSFMISNNIGKKDTVFAFGGGVVGDVAGFVASTYKRGIEFIQIPTTFLAQIDSSMGGKNAVNFANAKNMMGTFYQPKLIYINYDLLKSLTYRDFINGIVEMTVHGIIKNKKLFEFLEGNAANIVDSFSGNEEELIWENCSIKLSVVQADEHDTGLRRILNFGHTIGHAIEGAYEFKYQHGECVAAGIVGAFIIGNKLGYTEDKLVQRIITYIQKIEVSIHLGDMDINRVMELMLCDKKNFDKQITFIIPIEIGNVEVIQVDDVTCIKETLKLLKDIFN